ncbi:hypothetical protein KP509_24G021200 [Ceratopteris richardii]|nr:hypothetical protein KP509_24G021200 [Ceratopteris richardii]
MQALCNVPAEQSDLIFGDTVFKGDLSEVRNDSPLLLTRELQRSLSTPCIYPFPDKDLQVSDDKSKPFEVVGGLTCCANMKFILKEINKAIRCGIEPTPVSGGLGGAYYFRNTNGDTVAIVKPTDEEPFAPNNPKGYIGRTLGQPGVKKAVRVGETGVREVAAYLLDHGNFARVPPTVLVKVAHHAFHVNDSPTGCKRADKVFQPISKLASCQKFVHHDYDANDRGTSCFSVADVHRIGILDIRICNTDRHAGNILISNVKPLDNAWKCSDAHVNGSLELIPIDHGLCLPEALEDAYFEWLHWPQASVPFSEQELDYISRLDEHKDADMLRRELPMLRESCFRILILCTTLLKRAAVAGLCLAEIGEMMTRDGMEDHSEFEVLCIHAKLEAEKDLAEKRCVDDDDYDDAAVSDISVVDDFHEQFEFELDHDFDYKLNSMINDTQFPSVKEDIMLTELLSFPFFQDLSSNNSYTVSSRNLQLTTVPIWQEALPLEEEEGTSTAPSKVMAQRQSSRIGKNGSLPKHGCRTDIKSPRSPRVNHSARLQADFRPLLEGEERCSFAANNKKIGRAFQVSNMGSPKISSLRSEGFHKHKKGHPGGQECKTTEGKVNSNSCSPSFLPGDISDELWGSFMSHFEDLLESVLANKRDRSVSCRQRLGMSCQF